MPFRSALPRLMLIAMLLFASIGNAFDGAHAPMRMTPVMAMQMVVDSDDGESIGDAIRGDTPACHEQANAGNHTDADHHYAGKRSTHAPGAPDCCQIGHCDGFCLQALPAMAALARGSNPMPAVPLMLPADQPARPAPPLARPQRPPIA